MRRRDWKCGTLSLYGCYSGPLNWFPDRCCLTDSFDPAASPSFLHTTCEETRGKLRCAGREAERRDRGGGGGEEGVFLPHFTGSQLDFELEADTHDGRAISESPSPHGCSLLLRSLCTKREGVGGGARGDPADTTVVLL